MEIQRVIDRSFAAFLLLLIFSSSSTFAIRQGDGFPHMTSDAGELSGLSFDYIIVGGGTSGCPLAATLSKRFSVLLVERGGLPFGDPLVTERKNYGFPLLQTDEFSSVAQRLVSEEGVTIYRGRVLGGSTAINGGFYSRASKDFIKKAGWNEEQVRDSYEWVESQVVFVPRLSPWHSTVKDSFLESGILPFNGFSLEHLEGTKVGGNIFDELGMRHTAAHILKSRDWSHLTVLLNTTVKNVIFRDNEDGGKPRACGIRFIRSNGSPDETYEIYLSQPLVDTQPWGDIILSAGALGSPQILMLSGIGPQEHLKQFDIVPIVDARNVGKGIKDNPQISLSVDSEQKPRPSDPAPMVGIIDNFQIIVQSGIAPVSANATDMGIIAKVAFPRSEGILKLRNTDPRRNPSVKYNYLSRKGDLDKCVKMGRLIERVAQSKSIDLFLGRHRNKTRKSTAEELREFCKKNVASYYHYHGGCAVGSVVDEDYRVHGVEGLRVVDGSTLVESPGSNPMATLLMLGRYQGMKILREREQKDALQNKIHGYHYWLKKLGLFSLVVL